MKSWINSRKKKLIHDFSSEFRLLNMAENTLGMRAVSDKRAAPKPKKQQDFRASVFRTSERSLSRSVPVAIYLIDGSVVLVIKSRESL